MTAGPSLVWVVYRLRHSTESWTGLGLMIPLHVRSIHLHLFLYKWEKEEASDVYDAYRNLLPLSYTVLVFLSFIWRKQIWSGSTQGLYKARLWPLLAVPSSSCVVLCVLHIIYVFTCDRSSCRRGLVKPERRSRHSGVTNLRGAPGKSWKFSLQELFESRGEFCFIVWISNTVWDFLHPWR